MRVLHIIDTLGRGGAETFLAQLLPRLAEQGVESELLALRPPYTLAPRLEASGIRVHRAQLSSVWNWFAFESRLRRVLANSSFQAIHGHLFGSNWNAGLSCWLAGRRPPLVTTFHSEEFSYHQGFRLRRLLRKKVFGLVLRRAGARLTAVSQAAADSYAGHCGLVGAQVIYPGVEPAERRPSRKDGDFRMVMVATMKPVKGHSLLLRALRLVGRWNPETRLRLELVGEGQLREALQAEVRQLGLENVVEFHGELPNERVRSLLPDFDLFVLPSLSEGLPITLLEAMMAGVPVLAAAAGGIPEVIRSGENGLLFSAGNEVELARFLERAACNPATLGEIAARAHSLAMERFQIEKVARRWSAFYRSLSS